MIFSTWGSGKGWDTYHVQLDDAFFGARPDTSNQHPSLEGFDLRLDTFITPPYLRSLRIVAVAGKSVGAEFAAGHQRVGGVAQDAEDHHPRFDSAHLANRLADRSWQSLLQSPPPPQS